MNSLFLITGNRSLRPRKVLRISALVPAEESRIGEFPCTFPGHQGTSWRDEFATDCVHRHLVHCFGDGEAGARVGPQNPVVPRGFGLDPGEPEPETAGSGLGRRRSRCLSLLRGWPVRFRFRFAPAKGAAQQICQRPHGRQMLRDRAAQNESVSRNWAGELSASGR
jgi:hypothetical protein